MSPLKIVLLVLVVLALLYGASIAFANGSEPDPDQSLSSLGASLGKSVDKLAERFSPGFDFKSVSDPHIIAKTKTINVPHGSSISIRINPGFGVQRLKFTQVQPPCNIRYHDENRDVKKDQVETPANMQKPQTYAMTDQGGTLTLTCTSNAQNCILKVK